MAVQKIPKKAATTHTSKTAAMQQKREYAELLYCHLNLAQNVVAVKAGVSAKTINQWVDKYAWDKVRKQMFTTRESMLRRMYDMLDSAIADIDGRVANSKEADAILKLTAAIKNLESELNIADIITTGMAFIKYLQQHESQEIAIDTMERWNGFIQLKMK